MRTGIVFTMFKCVNPNICSWVLSDIEKKRDEEKHVSKSKLKGVSDPCSKYPDCQSCIAALDYCGWCTVDVLYNGTVPGTQCAGLNQSKIPGFICGGIFSTVSCPNPPTRGNPKAPKKPPTTIPPLKPSAPHVKPPPTKAVDLWTCNPNTTQCVQNATGSGGMPFDQCNQTCMIIPDVPIILRGKRFRGLEIEKGYYKGEYTAKFTSTSVTFADPKGTTFTAIVSQTGQYLVMNLQNAQKIFTLWQYSPGSVVDYLSWAWGAPGGSPPNSFDSAMGTTGQNSFVFDTCSPLAGSSCSFTV